MRKLIIIVCILAVSLVQAQDGKPTYEKVGDLVKATYYYDNGDIKEQGFFKDKKLTGTWTRFDAAGNKVAVANYLDGNKVGKWFIWNNGKLSEIDYSNNKVTSVKTKEVTSELAIR